VLLASFWFGYVMYAPTRGGVWEVAQTKSRRLTWI
jgi:hypothetical protein